MHLVVKSTVQVAVDTSMLRAFGDAALTDHFILS